MKALDDLTRGHLQRTHVIPAFDIGPDDLRSEDVVHLDLAALHEAGRFESIERLVRILVGEARNYYRPARTDLCGPASDPQPVPECTEERQQKDPRQDVNHTQWDAERPADGTDIPPLIQSNALHCDQVGAG